MTDQEYWVFRCSDLSGFSPHAMGMHRGHSGIVLRLNLAVGWGYLASADRRSTHAFELDKVTGYVPGQAPPVMAGETVRYRVEGLRVTEVRPTRA